MLSHKNNFLRCSPLRVLNFCKCFFLILSHPFRDLIFVPVFKTQTLMLLVIIIFQRATTESVLMLTILLYHCHFYDGESNGNPLRYSCLENPVARGAWWAAVNRVTTSQTLLSDFTFTFYFHALEQEMATHSSVLAWRIPGTGEPGGLPSMGWHRAGHG